MNATRGPLAVLAITVLAAACGGGGSAENTAPPAAETAVVTPTTTPVAPAPTTTAAPATTAVPATTPATTAVEEKQLTIGFDGSSCLLDGPATVESGLVPVTFENAHPEPAFVMAVVKSDDATPAETAEAVTAWWLDGLANPIDFALETTLPASGSKSVTLPLTKQGEMVPVCLYNLTQAVPDSAVAGSTFRVN